MYLCIHSRAEDERMRDEKKMNIKLSLILKTYLLDVYKCVCVCNVHIAVSFCICIYELTLVNSTLLLCSMCMYYYFHCQFCVLISLKFSNLTSLNNTKEKRAGISVSIHVVHTILNTNIRRNKTNKRNESRKRFDELKSNQFPTRKTVESLFLVHILFFATMYLVLVGIARHSTIS